MEAWMAVYDGRVNGTVELTDSYVIIRRKGVLGLLTQGLKGEKRIPYSSITSVQFKTPGLTNGYIQFGVAGGIESKGGLFAATSDENTVMFTMRVRDQFGHLRDAVEHRCQAARQSGAVSDKPGPLAELAQLADLKDRGILTEAEFAEQKARLLR
jgi:hypothetical protein